MLELKILTVNVLLPTAIMVVAVLLSRLLLAAPSAQSASQPDEAPPAEDTRSGDATESPTADGDGLSTSSAGWSIRHVAVDGALILAAVVAVWLAFGLRVGFAWWPEDAWARIPWAVAVVGAGSMLTISLPVRWLAWALRGLALWLGTEMILPRGEAWEFLEPQLPVWRGVLIAGPLLSWWVIEGRSPRGAGWLGLAWLPLFAASAFLSKDFLRVTEPMLALAAVLGSASLGALIIGKRNWAASIAGLSLFGCGAAVASAQFNSFLGLPDALSWAAILSPAAAALLSSWFAGQESAARPLSWRYVLLTCAIGCGLAVAVVVWMSLVGGVASQDEWSWQPLRLLGNG